MLGTGCRAGSFERAALSGSGLEVANAIRAYLERANGDTRLALAMSVSDAVSAARPSKRTLQGAANWRGSPGGA